MQPRKVEHHDFDVASRLSGVKVDNVSHASSLVYNPDSQTTSLKVGTGANQITESYSYETLTGLLSNQKVQRGASTLLDLSYSYLRAGTTAGRTSQLTKITNNLDNGKDRGYEYDALGRLKKATGGATTTWTQTYTYDKYGNRTGVTATGTADDGRRYPEMALQLWQSASRRTALLLQAGSTMQPATRSERRRRAEVGSAINTMRRTGW